VAALEPSRSQFLFGRQLTARNRLGSGYGLPFWNRHGGNEMTHTLLLCVHTTVPLR
jgi:hypothetical protein